MDSKIEVLSAEVEALNMVDETFGELGMDLIHQILDVSVWKGLKGFICCDRKKIPVSDITTVEVAKWAVENGLSITANNREVVADILVGMGSVEVLEYFLDKGLAVSLIVKTVFCGSSTREGNMKNIDCGDGAVKTIQWLYEKGLLFRGPLITWSDESDVCHKAVINGRVAVLVWAAIINGFHYKQETAWEAWKMSQDPDMQDVGKYLYDHCEERLL